MGRGKVLYVKTNKLHRNSKRHTLHAIHMHHLNEIPSPINANIDVKIHSITFNEVHGLIVNMYDFGRIAFVAINHADIDDVK